MKVLVIRGLPRVSLGAIMRRSADLAAKLGKHPGEVNFFLIRAHQRLGSKLVRENPTRVA